MAPEILERKKNGKPVNVCSLGMIAYFLVTGYLPLDDKNNDPDVIM